MKTAGKILILSITVLLWNCVEADKEFVHDTTTISQMLCKGAHSGSEFLGEIYEYNKNENPVTGDFTQADVEGGFGLIIFRVPQSKQDEVDLTDVFIEATLTWDQFITPSLSGKHNVSGDGFVITVKSGVGTTRQYRIRGEYE